MSRAINFLVFAHCIQNVIAIFKLCTFFIHLKGLWWFPCLHLHKIINMYITDHIVIADWNIKYHYDL